MKVLKFGGTSVGTVDSLFAVKDIVEGITEPAIVVVSALGGITDRLINTAREAAAGNHGWRENLENISSRHFSVISNVVPEDTRLEVLEKATALLTDLKRIYEGLALIGEVPERSLNQVVSFGERLSSMIVASMIEGGELFNSLDFIKTERWFDKDIADQKLTSRLIRHTFDREFDKAIMPGFISTDRDSGAITNLGRGGSDFSAALVAAALDAEILEIWTDVDGFMTADPRIVANAKVMPTMNFIESMELCTFGAKVIYPPTIYPVFHKNIPIKVLNTFNPEAEGTLISDHAENDKNVLKGVSALKDISLITLDLRKNETPQEIPNRAFNTLSHKGIKIFPVTNPDPMTEFSFAVNGSDGESALKLLESEFAPEIYAGKLNTPSLKNHLSAVALVGENIRRHSRLAARIGHSLRRDGINVEAVSYSNSDSTFIFIVAMPNTDRALQIIHDLVF